MNISFKKTFYIFASAAAVLTLIYLGRPILVSMAMSLLISFILYPIVTRLESWRFSRATAAITTILVIVLAIASIFYAFGKQISGVMEELSNFERKLTVLTKEVVDFMDDNLKAVPVIDGEEIIDKSQEWVEKSSKTWVSTTFSRTTALLSGIMMVIVYTFLLLIYRSGLKRVVVKSAPSRYHERVSNMLKEMQQVGKHYLVGMAIMIGILGVANSLVLLLFGIDHAFFFGFMAAFLAIIPYVGTTFGAAIPVLYAFMTNDSYLIPLGIMGCFWLIQVIESNFLSPKIVGGNLNINALAAIISLIIGGYLWGVAGMILFLPLTAIFKVFCSYFDQLKPVSLLLSDELYLSESELSNKTDK